MPVARDFARIVEVVEYAKLPRQLMFVGRDLFPVHGERGRSVADSKVPENLIVGTVFFDDVDDMPDRVPPPWKEMLACAAFILFVSMTVRVS